MTDGLPFLVDLNGREKRRSSLSCKCCYSGYYNIAPPVGAIIKITNAFLIPQYFMISLLFSLDSRRFFGLSYYLWKNNERE
jgi:hypothetical protein